MALTPSQAQVVESSAKRLLVLSCAGSGKTTVITQRITSLWENGVQPEQILALTFGNKAAKEMKARILGVDKDNGSRVTVKTFHSFGLDIIRKYDITLGYQGKICVQGVSEKKALMRDIIKLNGGESIDGLALEEYIKSRKRFDVVEDIPAFADFFNSYVALQRERNLVDMEDMIWIPVQLLSENAAIREIIQEQYRYVFVDEYQDTSEVQNRFLDLIVGDSSHLCVVGDDDQAIYEWRGAKPEYILQKAADSNYSCIKLETNFRSQSKIIDIANELIKHNHNRVEKKIDSALPGSILPMFQRFASIDAEAQFIADTIRELIENNKYNASDIAVLCRNNYQFEPIQKKLHSNGISCDTRVFDENSQYIKFVNVLRAIVDLSSEADLSEALNYPNRSLTRISFNEAKDAYNDYYHQSKNYKTSEWLNRLYLSDISFDRSDEFRERFALITQLHSVANTRRPTEIIAMYINYMETKLYNTNYPEMYHFVNQVFDMAISYEEINPDANLSSFLEDLTIAIGSDETASNVSLNAVNLMTIHRSKGLEFKVVFIAGVHVGTFPNEKYVTSEYLLEAERRLFYVAITRAKELLFISSYKDPLGGLPGTILTHGLMNELPTMMYTSPAMMRSVIRTLPDLEESDRNEPVEEQIHSVFDETIKETLIEYEQVFPEKPNEPHVENEPAEETTQAPIELAENQDSIITPAALITGKELDTSTTPIDTIPAEMLDDDRISKFVLAQIDMLKSIEIPDKSFITIIGDRAINDSALHGIMKVFGFKKDQYQLFGYQDSKLKPNSLLYNFNCLGIVLGPVAHKQIDSDNLNSKFNEPDSGYPFCVNLISKKIRKLQVQVAIFILLS